MEAILSLLWERGFSLLGISSRLHLRFLISWTDIRSGLVFSFFSPETRKKKGVRKDEGRKTKTKTDPLNHHPAGTNHWYPSIRLLPRPPPKIPSSRTLRPSRSLSLQPPRNKLESNGSFCRKLDSSHARFCTRGKYIKTNQTTLLFFFDFLS